MNNNISQIKDYTDSYISENYTLPKRMPEPFVQEDRIMLLQKVYGVFTSQAGPLCAKVIRNSQKMGTSGSFKTGNRSFYLFPKLDPYEISFDKSGKIIESSISDLAFLEKSTVLKKIMFIVIERLALELSWQDTTHMLSCNAIDYRFSKDSEEPLEWHCDIGEAQAKYSFITLLSDPDDNESGWDGGNLLYTTSRTFNRPEDIDERLKIRTLPSEAFNQPNSPVWSIKPSVNDAILFGNKGMNHKISRLVPLNETGKRLILTVFDYGTKDEFSQEMLNTGRLIF